MVSRTFERCPSTAAAIDVSRLLTNKLIVIVTVSVTVARSGLPHRRFESPLAFVPATGAQAGRLLDVLREPTGVVTVTHPINAGRIRIDQRNFANEEQGKPVNGSMVINSALSANRSHFHRSTRRRPSSSFGHEDNETAG